MTLREFDLHVQGYGLRVKDQQELVAWHGALLLNAWVKQKISVDMLLGREQNFDNVESLKGEMRKRKKEADKKAAALLKDLTSEGPDVLQQISNNQQWAEEVARSIAQHDATLSTPSE